MNIIEFINTYDTVFVLLISFFALIISSSTLYEMKKQRDLSITPNLHIVSKNSQFTIEEKNHDDVDIPLPINWYKGRSYERGENLQDSDKLSTSSLQNITNDMKGLFILNDVTIPLEIINSGSTPALNINIRWNCEPIESTIETINNLNLGVKFKFIPNNCLHIIYKNHNQTIPFNSNDKINYILPFNSNDCVDKIYVPYWILIILNLKVIELGFSKSAKEFMLSDNIEEFIESNSPFVFGSSIEYLNNVGKSHLVEFDVEFHIGEFELRPPTDFKINQIENIGFDVQIIMRSINNGG